jgi:MFS family permease
VSAIGMKVLSKPLLARFGHRTVLIVNTALLGLTMTVFTQISPGTPVWSILILSFCQGFFSSIQFSSMNSLTYADVADSDASKASSIASTAQQMSLSFGVASASLVTAWFLGHVDQTIPAQAVPALHKAFFAMGVLTIFSSLTFWGLRTGDGANVSNHHPILPDHPALKTA